jgi:hypothetical protein
LTFNRKYAKSPNPPSHLSKNPIRKKTYSTLQKKTAKEKSFSHESIFLLRVFEDQLRVFCERKIEN